MQKKMYFHMNNNQQQHIERIPGNYNVNTRQQTAYSFYSPIVSPRSFNQKHSLKNTNSTATENSTTCHSTQEGFGGTKKSLRNMLISTRARNHQSENCISLRYPDIQEKTQYPEEKSSGSFFNNLFCKMKPENDEENETQEGCTCSPKCLWMDHWLNMGRNNFAKNSNNRRFNYNQNNVAHHHSYHHHPQQQQNFYHPNTNLSKPSENKFVHPSSSPSTESIEQIKKDLHRTQPKNKTFQTQKFISRLESILTGYSAYDRQIGYIQGMNIISSVLIYHNSPFATVSESLQILKFLMFDKKYRELYLNDFELAHKISNSIVNTLRVKCHDLYRHIVELYGIDLRIFVIGWLIPMLGNIVPLQLMHLIINNYLQKGWQGLMKILATMLLYLRQQILEIDDETYIMQMLSVQGLSQRMYGHSKINWEQIILSSRNMKLILLQ